MSACGSCGPGYASPKEAFYLGKKEKILYIPCIIPDKDRPDYLSTVDVDPESPTYQKVSDKNFLNFFLHIFTKPKKYGYQIRKSITYY